MMSNKNSKGNKSSNQNNSKKSGNKSNRDDFDSGKKVSASKPTKIPRKQLNVAKHNAELKAHHPELIGVPVNYEPTKNKLVPAIQKQIVESGDRNLMAKKLADRDYTGMVRADDMIFEKHIHHKIGFDLPVVFVHQAGIGTKLEGLSRCKTFITLGQVFSPEFKTKLTDLKEIEDQERMYNCLHQMFKETGVIPVAKNKKPATKSANESFKFSSFAELEKAKLGFYDFSENGRELVVKHFKDSDGNWKFQVVKISENHPLVGNNIAIGFTVLSSCYYRKGNHDQDTASFVHYLREVSKGDTLIKKTEKVSTETPDVQLGIAVASQFQTLHPEGEKVSRGLYDRCHGPTSTHQKV